jgi:hypothetical protein
MLIDRLTEINSEKNGSANNNKKHVLLILDDCVTDTRFHGSKTLKILVSRGRHFHLSLIVLSQFILSLPPIVRSNADFICCSQMNRMSLDLLCDEYQTATMTRPEFIKMYANACTKYGFLVINNSCVEHNTDPNETYGVLRTPVEMIR